MALTDAQIQAALPHIGVYPPDFQAVSRQPNYQAACAALDELKKRAHKNFKKAARELHPDLNGNDPTKVEIYKTCVEMLDQLDKLVVRPPQPPPRPMVWVRTTTGGSSTSTATFHGVTIRII